MTDEDSDAWLRAVAHAPSATVPHGPTIGIVVDGRFRIEEAVGRGGFGTVHSGVEIASARKVAIKIVPTEGSAYERFEREAQAIAAIGDVNVVGYVAHGHIDDARAYLVMEWLEGLDLARFLEQRGPLSIEETLTLAVRAASGLAAAHARNILHRDVKPSNIFLVGAHPDDVRLIDFGIARHTEATTRLTQTGALLGTPQYMAPEQARGATGLSSRIDVFALGCVMFECLTGLPPFEGPTSHAVLARILQGRTPRLSSVRRDVSPALDALVLRMMAHDPFDRFSDGRATALAISDVLANTLASPSWSLPRTTSAATSLLVIECDRELPSDLDALAEGFGGLMHHREKARALVTFELASALECATRAAMAALEWSRLMPKARVAVLARRDETLAATQDTLRMPADVALFDGGVVVDRGSAILLQRTFEIRQDGAARVLVRRREASDEGAGAIIGRARELAAIDGAFNEGAEEQCARVVVIVGEPGSGKTRLLAAARTRLMQRSNPPTILTARCDRPTSHSPFATLAAFLRERYAIGGVLSSGELFVAELRRSGLSSVDAAFIAHLAGVSTEHAAIVAALRDPLLMVDAIRCAWIAWVGVELREHALVLIVDDIQFGDTASLRLLATTAELADAPLLVIASSRTEDSAVHLALLEPSAPERIDLRPLRPQAAADLVRVALADPTTTVVDAIVARGNGNPLRLLEIARGAVDGDVALDALAERKIRSLGGLAERVVRLASVQGARFSRAALVALASTEPHDAVRVGEAIDQAIRAGVFVRAAGDQLRFHHAAFQEAAYALLDDADKRDAHARVARGLAAQMGADPSVVAWHFECGGESNSAIVWYQAAARAALGGAELKRARELVDRALASGPTPTTRATLLIVRADAALAENDLAAAVQSASEAFAIAKPSSVDWVRAARLLVVLCGQRGDNARVAEIAARVAAASVEPLANADLAILFARASTQLFAIAQRDKARSLLDRAIAVMTDDPIAQAHIARGVSAFAVLDGAYDVAIDTIDQASRLHAVGGDLRGSAQTRMFKASMHAFVGELDEGLADLDVVDTLTTRTGTTYFAAWSRYTRGKLLALFGDSTLAREVLDEAVRKLADNPRIVAGAHLHLSLCALRVGDGAWADTAATAALAAHHSPIIQACASAARARSLVMLGQAVSALPLARRAADLLAEAKTFEENERVIPLALAESLAANGLYDEARVTTHRAVDRLRAIAAKLARPSRREAFLYAIDSHAKTFELAHRLGVLE